MTIELPLKSFFKTARFIRRSRCGFTLLEVMICLSIIAIALMAVYGNYSHTIAMSADQQFNATAPLLAARVVADYENRSTTDLIDESGNFGSEFDNYNWEVAVETITSETLGSIAEDLYSLNITVSFNDAEKIFQCKTVRFVRRETGN